MLHEYLGLGLLLEHEQHAVLNDFGQVASVFFSLIHQLLNNAKLSDFRNNQPL
jgi:hypothetical protein